MQSSFKYNLFEKCELLSLTEELASLPFHCGDSEREKDLEDFFHHEAILYAKERLGKTYCFVDNEGEETEIVAFFTVSNDSVKTTFIPNSSRNKVQRRIPGSKHLKYLYVNEREERVALHIPENEEELYTRLMFLDLMYTEIMESPF